jgi:hypothetical protein
MTQLLSYEEWKEKNIQINDNVLEEIKFFHKISDDKLKLELEHLYKKEYELYVKRTTDPEKFNKWLQEHYNEKLNCYDV